MNELTITLISVLAVATLAWAYFRSTSPGKDVPEPLQPKEVADHLVEPIISYCLYVVDTRLNRRLEMQPLKEFPGQFGILNGQSIELHWNVLNADWISIEGTGFVQAIGRKELYPTVNTKYSITAKNRNHTEEAVFFVRVFPVPVMEKLMVKMPEITTANIELFKTQVPEINRLDTIPFPSLQIPGVIQIQRENVAQRPEPIFPDHTLISRASQNDGGASFKSKIFDKMEHSFKDNYKIRDILQTIRKHYDTK